MRATVSVLLLTVAALAARAQTPDATPSEPDSAAVVAARGGALDLDVLPVRSVRGVAAWAPGVRRDLATGRLTVRARSALGSTEPRFLVDGVRQLGDGALPFEAVRRVRVLTEGVPARYGEGAGGLVLVETDVPADAFGARVEGYTSRATDAYGADLGAVALQAPLGAWGGAWGAVETSRQADASPYGVAPYQLTDEAYAALQAAPQSIRVVEGGVARFVPFPVAAAQAAVDAGSTLSPDDLRRVLGLSPDAAVDPQPISTAETLGEDAFERRAAKSDPLDDLRLAGGLEVRPLTGLTVRATGGVDRQRAEGTASPAELYERLLFARDALSDVEASGARAAFAVEHAVTPAVRYRLGVSGERQSAVSRPLGFSDRVEDALGYGDIDGAAGAVARRYFVFRDVGQGEAYQPWFAQDAGTRPGRLAGLTFVLPGGGAVGRYDRSASSLLRVEGAVEVRRGAHQLQAGASLEQEAHRRFVLDGYQLASYVADANGPEQSLSGFPTGITDYADLPFAVLRHRVWRYGYSFNGLEETDAEDPAAYFPDAAGRRQNTDLAPFNPRTLAGYLEDAVTLGPLALRAGVRVEAYDANTTVPLDLYAPYPIVRAHDLASAPAGVGPDYAVYYNGDQVVGYRDLDGRFYDDRGIEAVDEVIRVERRGQVRFSEAPLVEAFRDAPIRVSVEPRLSLAFDATDRVRLHASYDRLSRRPDPSLYAPFADFEAVDNTTTVGNAALGPETLDALTLGGEGVLSPSVSVSVGAFARRTRGLPVLLSLSAASPSFLTVLNEGRLDEIGADVRGVWSVSSALTVEGGYTLAVAEAWPSDPEALSSPFYDPNSPIDVTFPAPADTRHAVDLVVSGRVPRGVGPRIGGVDFLGGVGGGLVVSAQSGLPYTATDGVAYSVRDRFSPPIDGTVSGARRPWTRQVDLRLEKRVPVAGVALDAFVWVENLLDTDNVLSVYRLTRQADTDRFPETPTGQSILNTPERAFAYRAFTTGAVNVGGAQSASGDYFYGRPRQIRLGLRATF